MPAWWIDLWKLIYKELLGKLTTPAGGIGTQIGIGSGYDTEADRMERSQTLLRLCEEAVARPEWQPANGVTYCNQAARFIAQGMGCDDFTPEMLAIDMIKLMGFSAAWREDSLERGHAHALKGGLAFVTLEEHPHAHLCAIAPALMQPSGSWGQDVPSVANVGKTNGIILLSRAFKVDSRPFLRVFLWGAGDA